MGQNRRHITRAIRVEELEGLLDVLHLLYGKVTSAHCVCLLLGYRQRAVCGRTVRNRTASTGLGDQNLPLVPQSCPSSRSPRSFHAVPAAAAPNPKLLFLAGNLFGVVAHAGIRLAGIPT